MRFNLICLLASFAVCLAVPSSIQAEVVTNGSFQQPDVPDTNSFAFFVPGQTIGAGWVVDPNSASAVLVSRASPPTPLDGDQFLIMGTAPEVATVWQDLVLDAANYRLSFQLGSADAFDNASVSIDVTPGGGGTSIMGGAKTFDVSIGSGFVAQSMDFSTSSAGSYRLVVAGVDGSPAIDAFVLQQVSSIPEPSSLAFLTVIAMPACMRRRRK